MFDTIQVYKEQPLRSTPQGSSCSGSVLQETKYKLFYTYVWNTLEISIKGSF